VRQPRENEYRGSVGLAAKPASCLEFPCT
jgi:hypothetical protein